jgi:hypothetical protein
MNTRIIFDFDHFSSDDLETIDDDFTVFSGIFSTTINTATTITTTTSTKPRKIAMTRQTSIPIRRPKPMDVLLGRGRHNSKHLGNTVFYSLIDEMVDAYYAAKRNEKLQIAQEIMAKVRQLGRFIRYDVEDQVWHDIPYRSALEKVGHAFRYRREKKSKAKSMKKVKRSIAHIHGRCSAQSTPRDPPLLTARQILHAVGSDLNEFTGKIVPLDQVDDDDSSWALWESLSEIDLVIE